MSLTQHSVSFVDYNEMVDIIETKYDIDTRDYAGKFGQKDGVYKRGTTFGECLAYMEFKGFDPETWRDTQGNEWAHSSELSLMKHADTQAGIWTDAPAVPYQDFWHYILDCIEVNQGAIHTMNFAELRDSAKVDWQKEIAQLFVDEFGDKDLQVMIDW